jgi:DNA invertase Pin-like site-specific DNA recombinase
VRIREAGNKEINRIRRPACYAHPMRAVIYSRVSTLDKGQDPERQARELRALVKNAKWQMVAQLEDRISAAKHRPALENLWKLCRARKVDVVIVHEFSRFARSTMELLRALEEFKALGIQFISLKEQVDTTTPMGKLVFTIMAGLAEFERELIRDRVRSGMANARAKGIHIGRRRATPDIAVIRQRRDQGATWRALGKEMGLSPETCRRKLLEAS